jgi:hypothetical protein
MVPVGPGRALVFLPTLVFLGEYLACHPAPVIWSHSHPNLLLIDMYENDSVQEEAETIIWKYFEN